MHFMPIHKSFSIFASVDLMSDQVIFIFSLPLAEIFYFFSLENCFESIAVERKTDRMRWFEMAKTNKQENQQKKT